MIKSSRIALLIALLPGALIVALSFQAGGFFPGAVALGACLLALVLALQVLGAIDPFGGLGPGLLIAGGALALLCAWTMLSGNWSHAQGRAVLEADRVLLYLLAFVAFGALPRTPDRVRWLVRGLALGALAVCACGLMTRLLPHVWPTAGGFLRQRLSYPVSYWNALGLLASLGLIFNLHLAGSSREPRAIRVLGTAALPVLAATLLLTYSRGAMAAAGVGLVAYLLLARSRGLVSAVLAGAAPTAVAVVLAYNADALGGPHPTSAVAVTQGRHVAIAVGLAVLAAAGLRAALLLLDDRLETLRRHRTPSRVLRLAVGVAVAAVAAAALAASPIPGAVAREAHKFTEQRNVQTVDARDRLTDPGNNGRIDHWKAALSGFRSSPLHGQGAGTYEFEWDRKRTLPVQVVDAHSLYLETLDELGVVGLALLIVALGAILLGFAWRIRGRERAVYAALFAAGLAWALHAAIDWDWEMPAITLWLFAAGGMALARPATLVRRAEARPPMRITRVGLAGAIVALAALPGVVAASQAHLNGSLAAVDRGDCATADRQALSSISALGDRPEPFEVLGYCDVRAGRWKAAVRAMDAAVRREPANWRYHYDLAVAQAGAGLDPRGAALVAYELNPIDPSAHRAEAALRAGNRRTWRRLALLALREPQPASIGVPQSDGSS